MAEWIGVLPDTRVRWGIVFDIDGTLYTNPEYGRASAAREIELIGEKLVRGKKETEDLIASTKEILIRETGSEVTLTQVVSCLQVSFYAWNQIRERAWTPEKWLKEDAALAGMLWKEWRRNRVSIAFGTNAPRNVGMRTLLALGIIPDCPIFGPESFGISKPDKRFFASIAEVLGLDPQQCFCIGDRRFTDVDPAIAAGFSGGVVVSGRDELFNLLPNLLNGETDYGSA